MDRTDREQALVTADLSARFSIFPPATIARLVCRGFESFRDAPVRTYIPLLARRIAETQLRQLEALPAQAAPVTPAPSRQRQSRVPARS
jgi:hypothetical protein